MALRKGEEKATPGIEAHALGCPASCPAGSAIEPSFLLHPPPTLIEELPIKWQVPAWTGTPHTKNFHESSAIKGHKSHKSLDVFVICKMVPAFSEPAKSRERPGLNAPSLQVVSPFG